MDKSSRTVVLFLGPFALESVVEQRAREWKTRLQMLLNRSVHVEIADPVYGTEDDIECKGYWVRPVAATVEARIKMLRKQLFSGVVSVLAQVCRTQPSVIVGYGQGGLIASMLSLPLAVETACRMRILTSPEMTSIRKAWCKVVLIVSANPEIMPAKSDFDMLSKAVPEMCFLQPRGIPRVVSLTGKIPAKVEFGRELADTIGGPVLAEDEVSSCQRLKEDVDYLLRQPIPLYFEDDPSGVGSCVVCGRRGVFGRCRICGSLVHHSCVAPLFPGDPQPCPRCAKPESENEVPEEYWKMGIQAGRFGPEVLKPQRVLTRVRSAVSIAFQTLSRRRELALTLQKIGMRTQLGAPFVTLE